MADLTCNINPLQPTGFRLVIDRKNYPNVEFFANTVNHPNMELDAATQAVPRLGGIPWSGDALTFGELNVTILVDEDMHSYRELYDWMARLVQTNQQGGGSENVSTESDIRLQILTSHNNVNKEIVYRNAIPTSLGTIPFVANTTDIEPVFVDASFRFMYFELVS